MNKTELIESLASNACISKTDAKTALESLTEVISNALNDGEKVALTGFGTFSCSERAARIGRNPKTGEAIQIAAKNVVKFKPGKELTSKMN